MSDVIKDVESDLNIAIKAEMERINSKEDKVSKVEVETSDVQDKEPFYDEALKMGYDPDHKGPNKKSAQRFVEDKSFFDKIASLKKDNEDTKKMVKELAEHNARLEKATYDKAIADIKAQRDQAVLEANLKQVQFLDEKKEVLQKAQAEVKPIQAPTEVLPAEVMEFVETNKDWFNNSTKENRRMAEAADLIDRQIQKENMEDGINLAIKDRHKMVLERIKVLYPHRFSNENQEKKPLVARSTEGSSARSASLADRLSDHQKAFVKKAREYGGKLTNEDYARQLQTLGQLKDE